MPRTIGAKDRAAGGRVRNETDEAKAEREKKRADTRAAKQKRKLDDERAATADLRATFFQAGINLSILVGQSASDGGTIHATPGPVRAISTDAGRVMYWESVSRLQHATMS